MHIVNQWDTLLNMGGSESFTDKSKTTAFIQALTAMQARLNSHIAIAQLKHSDLIQREMERRQTMAQTRQPMVQPKPLVDPARA